MSGYSSKSLGDERFHLLAEEFLRRLRAGEAITVEAFCNDLPSAPPGLAEQLSAIADLEDAAGIGPAKLHPRLVLAKLAKFSDFQLIGAGGCGSVYRCFDVNRHVYRTIKILHQQPGEAAIAELRDEANKMDKVRHANIVRLYEFDALDGLPYYVMEYVAGGSLRPLVHFLTKARPKVRSPEALTDCVMQAFTDSPAEMQDTQRRISAWFLAADRVGEHHEIYYQRVARFGHQVALALVELHGRALIHRDLKPENMLLEWKQGKPSFLVTDFGMAMRMRPQSEQGRSPRGCGTRYYRPPDWDDPRCATETWDVYSLGVMLFELAVLPEGGLGAIQNDPYRNTPWPLANNLNPQVPRELATIIAKACAHEPGERYTIQELEIALKRWIADTATPAEAAGMEQAATAAPQPPQPMLLSGNGNKTQAVRSAGRKALALVVLVMLMLVIGQATWFKPSAFAPQPAASTSDTAKLALPEAPPRETVSQDSPADTADLTRPHVTPASARAASLITADDENGMAIRIQNLILSARQTLAERPAGFKQEVREILKRAGEFPISPEERLQLRSIGLTNRLQFDACADPRQIPISGVDLLLFHPTLPQVLLGYRMIDDLTLEQSGAAAPPAILVCDAETFEVQHALPVALDASTFDKGVTSFVLSPDGRRLFAGCRAGQVVEYDMTQLDQGPVWQMQICTGVMDVAYVPDEDLLVVAGFKVEKFSGWEIVLVDLKTRQVIQRNDHPYYVKTLQWIPGSNEICFQSGYGGEVWRAHNLEMLRILNLERGTACRVAGSQFIQLHETGIYVHNVYTDARLFELSDIVKYGYREFTITGQGERFAISDESALHLHLWSLSDRQKLQQVPIPQGEKGHVAVAWSPDGRKLLLSNEKELLEFTCDLPATGLCCPQLGDILDIGLLPGSGGLVVAADVGEGATTQVAHYRSWRQPPEALYKVSPPGYGMPRLAVSADGTKTAYVGEGHEIFLQDSSLKVPPRSLLVTVSHGSYMTFSDERMLLVCDELVARKVEFAEEVPAVTEWQHPLIQEQGDNGCLVATDTRLFVFGTAGQAASIDLRTFKNDERSHTVGTGEVSAAAWLASAGIVAGDDAGRLHVLDPDGNTLASVATPFEKTTAVCWAGPNRLVAASGSGSLSAWQWDADQKQLSLLQEAPLPSVVKKILWNPASNELFYYRENSVAVEVLHADEMFNTDL